MAVATRPRDVLEAMVAPDANGWKDAIDKEMKNLESHDVYEVVLSVPVSDFGMERELSALATGGCLRSRLLSI